MRIGVVHACYSLPFRQAVKLTFFAPFLWRISAEENIPFSPDLAEKQGKREIETDHVLDRF